MGVGSRARRYLLALWLACAAGAQEGAPREAPAAWEEDPVAYEPLRIEWGTREARIELAIDRWGEGEKPNRFRLRVEKMPAFVREAKWTPGDTVLFEPGESVRSVTLVLLLAEGGGPEGEIVLVVHAEEESISPRERRFVIPCSFGGGAAKGAGFAIRAKPREEVPVSEFAERIDRTATPIYACERIAAFFRPPLASGSGQPTFYWRIVGPAGESRQGGCWSTDAQYAEEMLWQFDEKTAPAPFGIELIRWPRDDVGCLPAGRYRILCAPPAESDVSLLGQKGARAGEFKEVASFELLPLPDLRFAEFVAEPGLRRTLERKEHVGGGAVEIASASVEGRTVRFSGSAAWRPRKRGVREGEWIPLEEDDRVEAWMRITFPETLRMSQRLLGECETEFQPGLNISGGTVFRLQFVGAVHGLVPVAEGKPDRALVIGEEVAGQWAFPARPPKEDAYAWLTSAFSPGAHYVVAVPASKTRVLVSHGLDPTSGRPPRSTGDHLRDPRTRFVLPVRFAFLPADGPAFDQLGYAVYEVAGGKGP